MDSGHERYSVLGIPGSLWSIALHPFVCLHRFLCADHCVYSRGLLSTEHCLLHVSHHGLICASPFFLMMRVTDIHHRAMPGPLHFFVRGYHLQLPAVLPPSEILCHTDHEDYWHIYGSVYPVLQSEPSIASQGFEACCSGLYAMAKNGLIQWR